MSKNIKLAENTSRQSEYHNFTTKPGNILVGNTQPYGSPTIDEVRMGVDYPNVHSAINDMAALFEMPVNTVMISTDGVSPAGVQQTTSFKFTGAVVFTGKNTGDDVIYDFYGFPVKVKVGDTGEVVSQKAKLVLDLAVSSGIAINEVVFGSSFDTLQVKFNDCQQHILEPVLSLGITVTPTIISPSRPGYGVWIRMGTQTITLDGGTGSTVLHYFRRDS